MSTDEAEKGIIAEIHEEGGIYLTEQQRCLLYDSIASMMHHSHPNSDGADERCEFCQMEPGFDQKNRVPIPIKHRDDCEGNEALVMLGFEKI